MLQGSPGSRLRQLLSHRFDWHVLTFPNEPPEKRKKKVFILILTLHARHIPKWLFLVHFSFFPYPISSAISFSPSHCCPPPLPHVSVFFSPSLLWISAHCATRKCTSRACQLHHGAFYLECPEPSVYQWNQPGI